MLLKVFKCKCLINHEYYALKEIPKFKLIEDKEILCHLNEPHILKKLVNYEFLPKLISSFQDIENLYLVTNLNEGLTLYHYKDENMTEEQLKFISACIIQSFIYLRKNNIIHRDIRMHNLILDRDNYINLLDFSYAINYSQRNEIKYYIRGEYFDNAPEIQNFLVYDYNSDYYRLGGSILFYFIFKKYLNKIKIEKKVNEIIIEDKNIPNFTPSCIDFINKLIITDSKKRIGFKSIYELKNHSWFNNFDWQKLSKKKIKSPLKFKKYNYNESFCTKFDFSINDKKFYKNKTKEELFKNLIDKYDYVNYQLINNTLNF